MLLYGRQHELSGGDLDNYSVPSRYNAMPQDTDTTTRRKMVLQRSREHMKSARSLTDHMAWTFGPMGRLHNQQVANADYEEFCRPSTKA